MAISVGLLMSSLGLLWLTQIGVAHVVLDQPLPQQIVMSLGLGLAFPALSSTALIRVREQDSGVGECHGQYDSASRRVPRRRPPNTIAATATATYIALARCDLHHRLWCMGSPKPFS